MTVELEKYSHRFHCMTSPCEVILYAPSKRRALQVATEIEKNTKRLEQKYNFFSQNSLIAQLNSRANNKQELPIDQETIDVLEQVRSLSQKTQGKFDITVGTLKQCTALTTVKEIEACRARLSTYIGPDTWSVSKTHILFENPHVKIDLGGVIKEYAVDQAGRITHKAGFSALINFGGDIYVNGKKPDESTFNVAIKNPKDPSQNIAILKLSDQGLTTSAHYERNTVVEGQTYSHIISDSKPHISILSATVISDSVLGSGIWSTSLMIKPDLPVDKAVKVILIDEQLRLHQNISAD